FRFKTTTQNPATFLYNTGPIGSLTDPNWNVRQLYSVTKVVGPRRTGTRTVLGPDLPTPPVRIGPRSTPDYATLADAAVSSLGGGVKTFAGPRWAGFYVDLGSIFDLGTLRPFQNLHLIPTPAAPGVNGTKGFNVHTIAIQVPKTDVTRNGFNPSDPADPRSVIGVWSAASRRKGTIREKNARIVQSGPWVQVSRLGEPLINEVVIELGEKDLWNSQPGDSAKRVGLLGGDLDGFPDGRRVFDNVTAVELRAIAGATYPLVDSSFTPDGAAGLLMDGTKEDLPFIPKFPYLAVPYEG